MTLKVWAAQSTVDTTGTGTTDFTHGTISDVPNAVLHVFTNSTANDSPSNQLSFAIGMSDGTDDRAVSVGCQHNVANANTCYRMDTGGCVASAFATGSTLDGSMSHNSFIAGGQRLNNDNAFSGSRLCNSLFFKTDNAKVLTATLSASVDTAVNVDPGFAWDCLIMIGCGDNGGSGLGAEFFFGFYDKTNQGYINFLSTDDASVPAGVPALRFHSDVTSGTSYVGGEAQFTTGNPDYYIEASVGAGTSCDLTTRNNGGDSDHVYCLFLGWTSSESVTLFDWAAPTSTGSNAVTGVGFQPQAAIHLFTFCNVYNAGFSNDQGGALGIGFDTDGDNFCASLSDEDASTNTDTQTVIYNDSIFVEEDDGTDGYKATFTSFGSDGWTHNWSIVRTAANKFLSIAFEEEAAGTAMPLLGGSNSSGGF